MDDHLIFYDGTCGFCHRSVVQIYKRDKNKRFLFAPLQGETAKKYSLPNVDSIILLENFKTEPAKTAIKGQAILKIARILYPNLTIPRLPTWLTDPPYDLVAYLRRHFFPAPTCLIPSGLDSSRFLP